MVGLDGGVVVGEALEQDVFHEDHACPDFVEQLPRSLLSLGHQV